MAIKRELLAEGAISENLSIRSLGRCQSDDNGLAICYGAADAVAQFLPCCLVTFRTIR